MLLIPGDIVDRGFILGKLRHSELGIVKARFTLNVILCIFISSEIFLLLEDSECQQIHPYYRGIAHVLVSDISLTEAQG